jgi:hypothetical protein
MKKNNNPFKMIGSWIGVAISVIIGYCSLAFSLGGSPYLLFRAIFKYINFWAILFYPINGNLGLIFIPITGFLIGWGITYLWRKFKK